MSDLEQAMFAGALAGVLDARATVDRRLAHHRGQRVVAGVRFRSVMTGGRWVLSRLGAEVLGRDGSVLAVVDLPPVVEIDDVLAARSVWSGPSSTDTFRWAGGWSV